MKKQQARVYISDFGSSEVGPLFEASFRALDDCLSQSRRTKANKTARAKLAELEQCLQTLARVHWEQGAEMTVTP